jgi:hypothetical protein
VNDDAAKLATIRELGVGGEWCLRHHFHFTFNEEGAYAAYEELRRLGFPDVTTDEELTGGGYWHVIAWRKEVLDEESLAATRILLENMAVRLGVTPKHVGSADRGLAAEG